MAEKKDSIRTLIDTGRRIGKCKAVGAYHSKRDTTRPVCCPCPGVL